MTRITAIVLTLNEEAILARCLGRLAWADEVLVIDSGSTDATRDEARRCGARVAIHPFSGWSAQRNFGAREALNDWVLFVDADEVVTHELEQEIRAAFKVAVPIEDAFALNRRNEFLGALLPNSQRRSARSGYVRLYNRRASEWDPTMLVHEYVLVKGITRALNSPLIQWRRQTTDEMAARINRYATVEADALSNEGVEASALSVVLRPVLRFGWHFVVKGEWRLGSRGVMHAGLRATADFLRYARLLERDLPSVPLHPPGYEPTVAADTA